MKVLIISILFNLIPTLIFAQASPGTSVKAHNILMRVKSVSKNKRSFITRLGRFDGITEGSQLVFKTQSLSFSARATKVSRFYSHWEVIDPNAIIPVKKNDYIIGYKGEEYLWAHLDGNTITKKHREALREPSSWIGVKGNFIRGLSESISNVRNDVEVSRNGLGIELAYYKEITRKLFWNIGMSYESETIDIIAGSLKTQRLGVFAGIFYLSAPIKFFYNARLMTNIGIGFGTSDTTSATTTQSGTSLVLPKVGFNLLFDLNKKLKWSTGLAFESISTDETVNQLKQSTDQLNLKVQLGFHYSFGKLSEYND